MNTLNIKLTVIGAVVLLVGSPLLHAISHDEVPFRADGEQSDVEPQEAVEKATEVNGPEDKPELRSPNQKFAIIADKPKTFAAIDAERHYWSVAYVRVAADWARSQKVQDDIEAIRKELYSFATDEEFEDPLPTLADHVIGHETSGISMPSDVFENRLRWMKDHDLVQFVSVLSQTSISARELTLSGFDEIRKKLSVTATTTELSWICQVQETHGKLEFTRSLFGGHPNPLFKGRSDARIWDVATVAMPVKPTSEVIVIPFFCLSRDRMIRAERTKAGHRDLLAFYRRENTLVNAELEGEILGGNSELNLARNPQRLKIMEFRTDGSPEFLASTTLYALRETDASIPGAHSESISRANALDTPVFGEGPSSESPQNSATGGGGFGGGGFGGGGFGGGGFGGGGLGGGGLGGGGLGGGGLGGGGFGGGGFGGGGLGGGGLADNSRRVYGKEVIVTWSEANDEIRGFSHKTGDWDIIKIAPQKEIVPSVSQNMVAVRIGDSVAAFSGEKCRWDVIELSKDSKSQPIIGDSLVRIEDNGHLYTFAAEKASWTSPTDTTLQPAEETMKLEFQSASKADYSSKVSRLVKEFQKWSDSLPRYKKHGMMFKARTSGQQGTIEFSAARQRWMPELKSKVEELRRLVEASDSASGPEESVDPIAQNAVATEIEQQIVALQVKLNALRSATPEASDAATRQPDKATLRKQVEQAFDVRQQLQELEAQKLRLKLQLIETKLESRQKNRDGIIERRVEELFTSGIDSSSKQKTENPPTHHVELQVFTAAYCGPCQEMNPILTRMIKEGLPVRILEITTEMEQARRFKIERIPTFVVTIDGQEATRLIGLRTEAELRQAIMVTTRELESEAVTASPVELPGSPRLPAGSGEAARPFQKDSTQTVVTLPANAQGTAAAMTWKQPSEIISELRKVQTEVESRRRHQSQMKELIRERSEKKKRETPGSEEYVRMEREIEDWEEENGLFTHANMEEMMRRWTQPWSEYQTQVRLLRLDVDAAKVSFELKRIAHQQRIDANKKYKAFSESEISISAAEEQQSKISLQRAEEVLRLYTDIEKNEPQLNPDYEAQPAEEATDAEAATDAKPEP